VSKIHGRFGIAGSAAVVLAEALFGLPAAADAATLAAVGLPFAAGQQVWSAESTRTTAPVAPRTPSTSPRRSRRSVLPWRESRAFSTAPVVTG
jgi:hypothetical protein